MVGREGVVYVISHLSWNSVQVLLDASGLSQYRVSWYYPNVTILQYRCLVKGGQLSVQTPSVFLWQVKVPKNLFYAGQVVEKNV